MREIQGHEIRQWALGRYYNYATQGLQATANAAAHLATAATPAVQQLLSSPAAPDSHSVQPSVDRMNHPPIDKNSILFSRFEWVNIVPDSSHSVFGIKNESNPMGAYRGDKRQLVLLVGYSAGFHIYQLFDSKPCIELYHRKSYFYQVTRICVLETLVHSVNQLAIVAAMEGSLDSAAALRIYSLSSHQTEHTLSCDGHIVDIRCSHDVLAVATENPHRIILHQVSRNFNPLICLTDVQFNVVYDLGSKYLAYSSVTQAPDLVGSDVKASNQPASTTSTSNPLEIVTKITSKVAKSLAESAKTVTGIATQSVGQYMSTSDAMTDANKEFAEKAINPGTIVILDVNLDDESTTIAHFKAHNSVITGIRFNPAGTLLVTISSSGTTFYVWEVPGKRNYSKSPLPQLCNCIYRLERGLTSALIENISFSLDSAYIAISTSRGTTHIYHIDAVPPLQRIIKKGSKEYELAKANGFIHPSPLISKTDANYTTSTAPSVYPIARLKQSLPLEVKSNHHTRACLITAFLLEHHTAESAGMVRSALGQDNLSSGKSPPEKTYAMALEKFPRQRVLCFHPQGVLSLHLIEVVMEDVSMSKSRVSGHPSTSPTSPLSSSPVGPLRGQPPPSPATATSGGSSWSGSSLSALNAMRNMTVSATKSYGGQQGKIQTSETFEWNLARKESVADALTDLSTIGRQVASSAAIPSTKSSWVSHIELDTFDPISFGQPLWLNQQFVIQHFKGEIDPELPKELLPVIVTTSTDSSSSEKSKKKKKTKKESPDLSTSETPAEMNRVPTVKSESLSTAFDEPMFDDPAPDYSDLPPVVTVEISRDILKPYGSNAIANAGIFPIGNSKNIGDLMKHAMDDDLTTQDIQTIKPLKDINKELSFEDAFYIDDESAVFIGQDLTDMFEQAEDLQESL